MHFKTPFVLRCTVLGILIAGFLGLDFALPLLFPGSHAGDPAVLLAVLFGSCIGQINLIAVWAALAQGNFVVRLPWSALLVTMMWYALILGNRMTWDTFFHLYDAVLLGAFLLAGIVTAQIPLWIARKVFRWQLISRGAPAAPPAHGRLQFNLQQMLLATTLLSVALAPLRTILPPAVGGGVDFHGEMLVLFAAVTVCNFLVTMPCIWGAMRPASKLMRLSIGWLLYCGLLTALEVGTLVALIGTLRPDDHARLGLFFYLLNVSQCATVFGALLLLRALGFQLVRGFPTNRTSSPAGTSVVSRSTEGEPTAANAATRESP